MAASGLSGIPCEPEHSNGHDLIDADRLASLWDPRLTLDRQVLAAGFLLVILSGALFGNWITLLVAATFVLAPIPNSLCNRCGGADDFSADYSSAPADFGRFLTSIIVVSGLAMPLVLAHADLIHPAACWMSITGGVLVYGTIITYSHFFARQEEF